MPRTAMGSSAESRGVQLAKAVVCIRALKSGDRRMRAGEGVQPCWRRRGEKEERKQRHKSSRHCTSGRVCTAPAQKQGFGGGSNVSMSLCLSRIPALGVHFRCRGVLKFQKKTGSPCEKMKPRTRQASASFDLLLKWVQHLIAAAAAAAAARLLPPHRIFRAV